MVYWWYALSGMKLKVIAGAKRFLSSFLAVKDVRSVSDLFQTAKIIHGYFIMQGTFASKSNLKVS